MGIVMSVNSTISFFRNGRAAKIPQPPKVEEGAKKKSQLRHSSSFWSTTSMSPKTVSTNKDNKIWKRRKEGRGQLGIGHRVWCMECASWIMATKDLKSFCATGSNRIESNGSFAPSRYLLGVRTYVPAQKSLTYVCNLGIVYKIKTAAFFCIIAFQEQRIRSSFSLRENKKHHVERQPTWLLSIVTIPCKYISFNNAPPTFNHFNLPLVLEPCCCFHTML